MPSCPATAVPASSGTWTIRLRKGARYGTWAVATIALAGVLGWVIGSPSVASFGADFPPILPSSILALLTTAVVLTALQGGRNDGKRRVVLGGSGLIAGIALLSLLQRMYGVPAGMEFSLARLGFPITATMSPGTAITFLILAAALAWAPDDRRRGRRVTRLCAMAVAGVALVALVGLTFRIVRLSLAVPSMGMALPVALALLTTSFCLMAMRPSRRLLQLLEHDSPGAVIFRRLLPAGIVLPILVGWAQALGQRSGWFDIAAGEGMVAVVMVAVGSLLILWTSSRLDDMNVRRSQAEVQAETQREWLNVVLANIGDAVLAADGDGRLGFMNSATESLCGIRSAISIGRPVRELIELVDERNGDVLPCPLEEAFAGLRPVTVPGEPAVRLPGGQLQAVEVRAMPILGNGGTLLGGVLVLRDAREERDREKAMRHAYTELDRRVGERTRALERASAALRESTALLQTIAASTPELIIAKDRDGRIMMINAAALQAQGLERAQALGRTDTELFGETEQTRRMAESDRKVMETGHPMAVEETLMTSAGARTYLVTKSPLRDDQGLLLGLVSVATDITDRKRAQRELEQLLLAEHTMRGEAERASRAKDEFLAIVSHELRSPLNALKGWSQVLATTRAPDAALVTRAAQAIKRNVEHQTRLIDDLLDTSRIIIGKLTLERRPVNLVEVVLAAIELSRGSAQAKNVELRFAPAQGEMMVDGDPGRLQQVVINLLSNGIKFTPRDGVVTIGLNQAGPRVELTVADNGIGIEPEFLPHVFDRFSQADSSTTRRYSGLGIGLALVRHLVEMHGGTVRVDSPGLGQGATFTVDLPAAGNREDGGPAGEETGQARTEKGLDGVQVLLVDDDPEARDVMHLTLAQAGALVRTFESGRQLLAMLRNKPPRLSRTVLLLDIAMPGEDGFAVLANVRILEELPFIPAIAVTALTHLDRIGLAAAGFQGCLGKPVEAARLIESILAVLGRPVH